MSASLEDIFGSWRVPASNLWNACQMFSTVAMVGQCLVSSTACEGSGTHRECHHVSRGRHCFRERCGQRSCSAKLRAAQAER